MPNIKVTDKLIQIIKEERTKKNFSAKVLSEMVGKSSSYISTLERGKIDFIKDDLFLDIFKKMLNTSDKEFEKYMNDLLADVTMSLTDEEMKKQEWMLQFSLVIRRIPITDDIIDHINEKLIELNKTPIDLTRKINENTYLDNKDDYEPNTLKIFTVGESVGWGYKYEIKDSLIPDILEKNITSINYIKMLGIIYNLYLFEGFSNVEAIHKSDSFLFEHKFYNLQQISKQRKKKIAKSVMSADEDEFYSLEMPSYEKDFDEVLSEILSKINFMRDINIEFSLKTLKRFDKNLKFDSKFMFTLLQIPFYGMKDFTFQEKQEVLMKIFDLYKDVLEKKKEELDSKKDKEFYISTEIEN
jgi:transcriptional regulator with XRE-family HTH domain